MKKTIKFSLLLAMLPIVAFINPLKAQDVKKEVQAYVKKFEDTYNKKDDQGLKMLYTDDASRTDAAGQTITGNENIRAEFADSWSKNKITISIKLDKAEQQADGSVLANGTYHISGSSNAGAKIERDGTYINTMIKVDGKWKMSKSVLGSM